MRSGVAFCLLLPCAVLARSDVATPWQQIRSSISHPLYYPVYGALLLNSPPGRSIVRRTLRRIMPHRFQGSAGAKGASVAVEVKSSSSEGLYSTTSNREPATAAMEVTTEAATEAEAGAAYSPERLHEMAAANANLGRIKHKLHNIPVFGPTVADKGALTLPVGGRPVSFFFMDREDAAAFLKTVQERASGTQDLQLQLAVFRLSQVAAAYENAGNQSYVLIPHQSEVKMAQQLMASAAAGGQQTNKLSAKNGAVPIFWASSLMLQQQLANRTIIPSTLVTFSISDLLKLWRNATANQEAPPQPKIFVLDLQSFSRANITDFGRGFLFSPSMRATQQTITMAPSFFRPLSRNVSRPAQPATPDAGTTNP